LRKKEPGPCTAHHNQPAPGEHFADAERILAALPLVKRSAERDRHVQIALVHAVLAIAAGIHPDERNTAA